MTETVWAEYERSWRRHLFARGRPKSTIKTYTKSLHKLAAWAGGRFAEPTEIQTADLEDFFGYLRRSSTRTGRPLSASTIAMDDPHLRVFFNWLADREDTKSPMDKLSAPTVADVPVPVFSADELRRLIATTTGKDFNQRRDRAIMILFMDTGCRRAEIANLAMDDLDLDNQLIRVTGKGDRIRTIPYAIHAAEALDLYLIARRKHADRELADLWLSAFPHRGPLGYDGVGQMLERRAKQAGLAGRVYLHRFRHTAASLRLGDGMSEGDAMKIFGWKSRSMVDRIRCERGARPGRQGSAPQFAARQDPGLGRLALAARPLRVSRSSGSCPRAATHAPAPRARPGPSCRPGRPARNTVSSGPLAPSLAPPCGPAPVPSDVARTPSPFPY